MKKFTLTPLALLITTSFAINANAEEVNAETTATENVQEEEIERIFIRGTKQELTLQEVDASVELFTGARLDAERIVDINDVLLRIPNVSSTGASNSISIRGIGRTGSTGSGQGVTSNVYVDGSPISGTVLSRGVTSLWDTQQVEVLRGTQSSIQGRNALAGAIVVSTADPTYEADGKFRLTAAEDSTYQIAGAYGNAIVDNQLAFRIAADYQKTDGFTDTPFFDKNTDFENRLLLRAKVLFEPEAIDDLSIKLTVDHNNVRIGAGSPQVRTLADVTSQVFAEFDVFDFIDTGANPRNDTETTRYILDTYYDLSKHWSIKTTLTHEDTDVDRVFGGPDTFDVIPQFTTNIQKEKVDTLELRFTFEYENISGVIGGYYFDNEDEEVTNNDVLLAPIVDQQTFGLATLTSGSPARLVQGFTEKTNTLNRAAFAQVRIDLTNALTLDLGVRYDDERFRNSGATNGTRVITPDDCVISAPAGVLAPIAVEGTCTNIVNQAQGPIDTDDLAQTVSFNAWLPKATLTYNFNDDHSVFASAQRGYRAGGADLRVVDDPNNPGNSIQSVFTYEPEFLNTVEIGSRSVFANGDITLNTNIFYSVYKDQQINTPGQNLGNPSDDLIINAAESTIYGAEFLFEYTITQAWDVYASVGLLKAEFDDFPFAQQGPFSNLEGNDLPNAPTVSGSIGANWVGQNGLFANISAFYTGSRASDFDNITNDDLFQVAIDGFNSVNEDLIANEETPVPDQLVQSVASSITEKVDSYINVNTRFGYETDNFTVYGYVTNIFDEEEVTRRNISAVNEISGEASLSVGGTNFNIIQPRTFGIGIDYAF